MISKDFSQDTSYKNWLLTNKIKLYSGPLFSSCKTDLLLPMTPHTGGRISIPISCGLQYIEFSQYFSV